MSDLWEKAVEEAMEGLRGQIVPHALRSTAEQVVESIAWERAVEKVMENLRGQIVPHALRSTAEQVVASIAEDHEVLMHLAH